MICKGDDEDALGCLSCVARKQPKYKSNQLNTYRAAPVADLPRLATLALG